jgi:epsilon-lactone hydrolase
MMINNTRRPVAPRGDPLRSKEVDHALSTELADRQLVEAEADPTSARAALRSAVLQRVLKRVPDDISVSEVAGSSPRGEWVSAPFDTEGRRIVFVHGGAFAFGSAAESRELVARLARASHTSVLALDYRTAPEHPLPAAIDDVLAAVRWLIADGITPREIAVVGYSTGGGVALAAMLALRDAGEPMPGALALMSPVVDLTIDPANSDHDPAHSWELIERHADGYLAGVPRDDRRVSPGRDELTGLPPMLVQLGTRDPVLRQGRELAARADAAGAAVTTTEWDGMFHGWQAHPHIYEAVRASNDIGEYLLQRIGPAYVPVPRAA